MQTLAGVILAFIGVAYLKALLDGRGREWVRNKLLGG